MFKKITLAAVAASTALTAFPAMAEARSYHRDGYYSQHYDRYGNRGYDSRSYRRGDYYGGYYGGYSGNRYYRSGHRYYGYDRRCRDSGTTGTILGAVAGGLLGREIAEDRHGRGDGTAGLIVGGALGALAGRAIDRNC
jgi:glycine zipper 2TM protein